MPKSKHSASMNLPQVEDGQPPHSEEPTKWTEEKDRTVDEDPRFQAEVGEIYRDCSQFQERHMKLALTRETSEDFYKQWKLVMGEKSQLGQRLQRLRLMREEELKRWPKVAKWLEESLQLSPLQPRPPSGSVAQRADSLRAVEVTSRDDGQSGSSPPVEGKRYNRDPSPSRQPPSLTSSQPVKSADGPSRPVNENKPSAGLRVVQSKYRETQPSAFEPEEGKRVGRGCVPRHSSSFLALHRPVDQTGMGPSSPLAAMLPDLMSRSTRYSMSNGDVMQLLHVEQCLRAQAAQLVEAADQLASLRTRSSMALGQRS